VRRWSMLLFDARPGTALDRLIPGPAAVRAVALAGESLADLHAAGVELPVSHARSREIETLDRWLACAVRACPEMAGRLEAARRRLAAVLSDRVAGRPVPSHRDYHPGQLLVAPRGVTILDLDTAAMAEPELDAGNFLAHLDLFELDSRSVRSVELGEVFRAAYERRAGRRLEPRRLLWYRAGAVLRLACVYRFRPRGAVLGTLLTRRCLDLLGSPATSLEVI
ncbi:MAG: phosphotransferase family protein, partial [Thermoanaerobaculia bacterium]